MDEKKLQLLVVDDDEDDYLLVRDLLQGGVDAEVERAATADQALERSQTRSYDATLLDYRLGAHSGLEVLREMRQHDVVSPVIFLTGHGDEQVAVEAMKAGATDYLAKSKLTEPALARAVHYAVTLAQNEAAMAAARRALQNSERRFRALVENSSGIITLLGADGTILYVSQSVERVLGYQPGELIETDVLTLVHPDDLPQIRAWMAEVLRAPGVPMPNEHRTRHKDGHYMVLEVTGTNRLYDDAVCAIVLNSRDISARRQVEEALRSSEHWLRSIIETANEGIWTLDAEERTTFVNPKMAAMLDYSPAEMLGGSLRDFLPLDNASVAERQLQQNRAGANARNEVALLRRGGQLIWVDLNSSAMLDAQGDYQGMLAMVSDVTEQKQAEDALRASEQRYRSLAIATAQIVWITDGGGEPIGDCSKWAAFTGQTLDEMRNSGWLQAVHPDDRERLGRVFRAAICKAQPYESEYRLRRHDGEYRYIAERGVPILDPGSGALREWVGAGTDITDSRNLQEQLLHAQKLEAVGHLAGGVAHDFNNLLMVIGSHAELLRDGTTDPVLRRKAQEILDGVERGASLTRQLLAFSRKQVLSPRVLNLNQTLAELGATLPRMLGEKVQVKLQPGADLWAVKADPAQIEQVIVNLAVNARDAMPRGGRLTLETCNVELGDDYARTHAGVTPGSFVMLAVSDTGEGIPRAAQPHIFEPFFTTKEHGKGTGLGLPTVYGIVQQSGGFIWVYSEEGQGTVFKIYLPKVGAPCTVETRLPAAAALQRGSETVLLVEDEEAVRAAVREYLSLKGYHVLEAGDGEQALAVAAAFAGPIHLLISDVVMPGMNGSDMARRLLTTRPDLCVLFVSGYTESTVGNHGIDAGAAFLQKPFSLSALAAKIRDMLEPKQENEL